MPRKGERIPSVERFEAKVDRSGECHVWTGAIVAEGYGSFWCGEVNDAGHPINVRAHRWAWEQAHGPIPAGMVVMHRCDNPPCVRLDHLRLGTLAENSADMAAKGRSLRGERAPGAKLGPEQVAAIRSLGGTRSQQSIADEFGISQKQVSNILAGRNW